MSVETRIGKRLAAIREHRRMSQADLAAALGVSKAAIGHYEHGRVRLTVPRLEQLALALHCRVADLLAPLDTPVPLGMYRLDAWCRSGRDVSMRDRHVTETEMTQALQRALLHATDEVVGDKRAISADVYCDCLVGLFLAASPQPETPEEIEQFVALFRDKFTAALARRGVVGHA